MPSTSSVGEIIRNVVDQTVQRIAPRIQRHIAEFAAAEVDAQLKLRKSSGRAGNRGRARSRPQDLMKWVADSHARRVPKFVIEMTGLDTKKRIVAKFGAGVVFEKGKPLPKAK